jgi:hypothetical protein
VNNDDDITIIKHHDVTSLTTGKKHSANKTQQPKVQSENKVLSELCAVTFTHIMRAFGYAEVTVDSGNIFFLFEAVRVQ